MIIDKSVFEKYPDILTTQQVAELLGIHPSHVTRLFRQGLVSFRIGEGQKSPFRVFKSSVIDYIKKREFNPEAAIL
jgi:AraC-like DNA-binding protein